MGKTSNTKFVSSRVLNDIKSDVQLKLRQAPSLTDDKTLAAWFMGTKGENLAPVKTLISSVVELTLNGRAQLFPDDPGYITQEVKNSDAYQNAMGEVTEKSQSLIQLLTRYSVPFSSLRYQGHMTWDVTLPSVIGYLAGMLQNQNNVTPQAAPATTLLEIIAANDISQMAGFNTRPLEGTPDDSQTYAWSHIACDGTVANIESVWAARELKFMPLAIKTALNEHAPWIKAKTQLKVDSQLLLDSASAWQLLNLSQDETLALPAQLAAVTGEDEAQIWKVLGEQYSLNARGMNFFHDTYLAKEDIKAPAIIVPSSKHYSWVKSTSLLGLGGGQKGLTPSEMCDINRIANDGLLNVYVDEEGRVDTQLLNRVLDTCREHKKPVIMNVAVVGSTEEGAVDPVESLLSIREQYRSSYHTNPSQRFEYSVHTDAAWGGYFMACIRNAYEMDQTTDDPANLFDNSHSWFRDSVFQSMKEIHRCDSVTIDPHKMGYVPYPAGSLTYRNENIINLLSFSAPYISAESESSGVNTRNIGESGIEGSKPGAAATSVYLSHQLIRPDHRGYGHIINQSMLNAKLFYLYLATLDVAYPEDKFDLVLLNPLPQKVLPHKQAIADLLWDHSCDKQRLLQHTQLNDALRLIAGDQNLVDYTFVDKADNSVARTSELNNQLFSNLSVAPGHEVAEDQIFVSMTTFNRDDYGDVFINALAERIYNTPSDVDAIPCIRSVVLDPWAIYTHEGGQQGMFNFFTQIFLPKLRQEVNKLC